LKTIGQHAAHHQHHLIQAGARGGDGFNRVQVVLKPIGLAAELPTCNAISPYDEPVHRADHKEVIRWDQS
jgi:hypothetical protein